MYSVDIPAAAVSANWTYGSAVYLLVLVTFASLFPFPCNNLTASPSFTSHLCPHSEDLSFRPVTHSSERAFQSSLWSLVLLILLSFLLPLCYQPTLTLSSSSSLFVRYSVVAFVLPSSVPILCCSIQIAAYLPACLPAYSLLHTRTYDCTTQFLEKALRNWAVSSSLRLSFHHRREHCLLAQIVFYRVFRPLFYHPFP